MGYTYDPDNIFAKILRGEIPNKTVLETEHSLAFEDIQPQAPVHVLIIPKGPYVSFDHFSAAASGLSPKLLSQSVPLWRTPLCKSAPISLRRF